MAEATATPKVSTTESGHAKNVANFGALITAVGSLGKNYQPTAVSLALKSLKTTKISIAASLADVAACEAPYRSSINKRQAAFEGMSKLATRVVNALAAVGSDKEIKDARSLARKVQGGGKLKAEDPAVAAKSKSTSQMSYDNRVQNFKSLVAYLSGIPAYKPNEKDLQIASLNKYLSALPALADDINAFADELAKARINRDKLLYAANTGAIDIGLKVKKYVKSIYGAASPEYKRISRIELKGR